MLVLSRRIGEVIVIEGNIEIKVCKIDRGRVLIGIKADRSIPVRRGEVYEKIKKVRKPE